MIGDDSATAQVCQRTLHEAGWELAVEIARTPDEFRTLLAAKSFQLILAEQTLPGWGGLEALELLQAMKKEVPFILLTSTLPDESVLQLLERGGGDFVEMDRLPSLSLAVKHALERRTLRGECSSLEAQLRHSRKMESVGRLAAGVAHDFNNILTVIQGHVGLLRTEPHVRPEVSESLQQVSRATERACKLTTQLLNFSRKHAVQPQPLDLNEVLTSLSMLLQRALGEDITIQLNYAPDLPSIEADRNSIEQLILDLAVHSRTMMQAGGQLVISTALADIDPAYLESHAEARAGLFVELSIIDTGCGLAPETLTHLFEPLFSTSEGPDLGLATVYGIVKQHLGWIEVQSQIGQGSTFKVFLPASKAASRVEAAPDAAIPGGSETILVVEDEAPVLWTVRNILEHYGYRVLGAASGMEALAIWHQHEKEIALLLTDIVMPVGVSGQELAEQFQPQKPGLKVIYTSGYSAEAAAKSLELVDGMNFLKKPYDAERLARAVRRTLDS